VTTGMPLENNCRFHAQGTKRHARSCGLHGHGSASMGNTGNPDFIIRPDNRILGYESPVPGYDHLQRVNTLFGKDLFNGGRAMIKNPAIFGRNDEFHASPCRLVSRFLKHPDWEKTRGMTAVTTGTGTEHLISPSYLILWINTYKYGSVQGGEYVLASR